MLGYNDLPLGLDSAPLVSKMLEDIVADTEALRENEEELTRVKEKVQLLEEQIEPLQGENLRLTRENVQLHQQLVVATEEALRVDNQNSAAAFELQSENRRLKLLNQKASQHVRELQKEIDQLKTRLHDSIAAPSMMKIPEVMEADPRKMRKSGSRTPSSSRATSVVSSVESSFTAPNISFDPNLFNTELDNLRKERDAAKRDADLAMAAKTELESVIKVRDAEIERLGLNLQRETGKDGYLVSLRHKYEQQQEEIEKLRAQVRVVNPTAKGHQRHKRMVLTPARTTVVIHSAESRSNTSSELEDGKGRFTFEAIGPMTTDSRMTTESSEIDPMDSNVEDDPTPPELPQENVVVEEEELQVKQEKAVKESQRLKAEKEKKKAEARKEKEKEKQKLLKQQQKTQAIINAKDQQISSLMSEIQSLTATVTEKEKLIASMCVDFAFINDNLATVFSEKENLIGLLRDQVNEPDEIIVDTEEVDKLQQQLRDLETQMLIEIKQKEAKIEELEKKGADSAAVVVETKEVTCHECDILRQQLESLAQEKQVAEKSAAAEIAGVKAKNAQLETLILTSQREKYDSASLDEQLQRARHELTEKDALIEKMRASNASAQNELVEYKQKLEETERKMKSQPNAEEKFKLAVDQLKKEHVSMASDLKAKSASIKSLSEKVVEGQRLIQSLQGQLQKTKEEAETLREDAAFHRAKGEEISKKTAERTSNMIRDTNVAIQTLQKQLAEKTKENDLYQKLLSEARRKLAPLMETVIPQFKTQIAQMQGEREELVKRVKRLAQFAVYVEQAVSAHPDSPDGQAFCAALHQLQEELKVFEQ